MHRDSKRQHCCLTLDVGQGVQGVMVLVLQAPLHDEAGDTSTPGKRILGSIVLPMTLTAALVDFASCYNLAVCCS